ncbi:hypothetical protein ABP2_2417 [Bacillus subtilis subsp. subtilis]|nr:hypothetical protein [Bacillus subtilis subsp. subtilis]
MVYLVILDNIERWLTLVGVGLVPVITLIMKLRKDYLEKQKKKHEKEIQQYNFSQHGNQNTMNVQIVNNHEQETYHKLLRELTEAKEKQEKLEKIATKIESISIKVSAIILILIAFHNLRVTWNTSLNPFENLQNLIKPLYNAFQSSGEITIYMMFCLSVVLILELLTPSASKISFRYISMWILIIVINVANILTLKLWNKASLGQEMNELTNKSNSLAENLNIESLLSYLFPFFILIQIGAVFIIANHIIKLIIVPEKEHSETTKKSLLISTLCLLAVPLTYLYYLP